MVSTDTFASGGTMIAFDENTTAQSLQRLESVADCESVRGASQRERSEAVSGRKFKGGESI
jgi:hypothetical protein